MLYYTCKAKELKLMGIHTIYMQDKSIHHIQEEHKGIKYSYISNIQQDNIFAIIKYTMPLSIEELFKNRNNTLVN
jgi:hypothetical protein